MKAIMQQRHLQHKSWYFVRGDFERGVPYVYDAQTVGETVLPGFNAVSIPIDGRLHADLDWKQAADAARAYLKQGLQLFWDLNLGISAALSDQVQYLGLGLSIEHLRNTLWPQFHEHTIGVCLHRGSIDFCSGFHWDEKQTLGLQEWLRDLFGEIECFVNDTGIEVIAFEKIDHLTLQRSLEGQRLLHLFCRDVVLEYLELLAQRLPDGLQPFVLLDMQGISEPYLAAQLLTPERFDRLQCAVTEGALPLAALQSSAMVPMGFVSRHFRPLESSPKATYGICMPSMSLCRPSLDKQMQQAMQRLIQKGINFRIIAETVLTTEWDGLDFLLVATDGLSPQGFRKLRGFCAAGGTVVTVGKPLGLPHEIPFDNGR